MRAWLQSAWMLLAGTMARAWAWASIALVGALDLYRLLRPDGWPDVSFVGAAPWVIAGVCIVIAVVSTFHEMRMRAEAAAPVPDMSLSEMAVYLTSRAEWLRLRRDDPNLFRLLGREIRDALALGHIQAFGRASFGDIGIIPEGFDRPLTPLPSAIWATHEPVIICAWEGGDRDRVIDHAARGRLAFYDVHVCRREVLRRWPLMPAWRRWTIKPWRMETIARIRVE